MALSKGVSVEPLYSRHHWRGLTGGGLISRVPVSVESSIPAAPSAQVSLRVLETTRNTITVEWDEIPCSELDSRLEEYFLTFRPLANPLRERIFTALATMRSHTATGLEPGTEYSITLNAHFSISNFDPLIGIGISSPINATTYSIPSRY